MLQYDRINPNLHVGLPEALGCEGNTEIENFQATDVTKRRLECTWTESTGGTATTCNGKLGHSSAGVTSRHKGNTTANHQWINQKCLILGSLTRVRSWSGARPSRTKTHWPVSEVMRMLLALGVR